MKTVRTYVFIFVPQRSLDSRAAGSAGILVAVSGMLPDNMHHGGRQCGAGKTSLIMRAAPKVAGNMPALPNHLFWTWFVDNPCRNLQ